MTEINRTGVKTIPKVSDRIIDGLFAGIIAGVVMAGYLLVVGMIIGDSPTEILLRFALNEGDPALIGGLFHLAVSAVYGALFGLGFYALSRFWRRELPLWMASLLGAAYGFLLYTLALTIILPGTNSALSQVPQLHFAIAHVIFGICLSTILGRNGSKHGAG